MKYLELYITKEVRPVKEIDNLIEASGIVFEYYNYDENGEKKEAIKALNHIDLSIKEGEFVVRASLQSAENSRKTTLLLCIYVQQFLKNTKKPKALALARHIPFALKNNGF